MKTTEMTPLVESLEKLNLMTNEDWLKTLSPRKRQELEFHDAYRDRGADIQNQDSYEKYYTNKKYYSTTQLSRDYVDRWIRENAKGRIFLDYACGNGEYAIRAAQAGASLSIGIDLSRTSILNARADAVKKGVTDGIYFVQADAEDTKLPDASVDRILCSGMLHHLDLSYALPELRRILKPGGKILAVEALDYNPLIKLYRFMTPKLRTEWEKHHILSHQDLKFATRFFNVREVRYWHLTSMAGVYLKAAKPVLDAVDKILSRLPGIQLMAWIFTFELVRPEND